MWEFVEPFFLLWKQKNLDEGRFFYRIVNFFLLLLFWRKRGFAYLSNQGQNSVPTLLTTEKKISGAGSASEE